jgi:DNA/RNA-binding domain of Phe-tRNA-synthetase-like protein
MENIINILKESKDLLTSKDLEELKEKLLTAYWKKQYTKMELDFNYVRNSVNDELEKIRQGG